MLLPKNDSLAGIEDIQSEWKNAEPAKFLTFALSLGMAPAQVIG
jgi:hypothetical protein